MPHRLTIRRYYIKSIEDGPVFRVAAAFDQAMNGKMRDNEGSTLPGCPDHAVKSLIVPNGTNVNAKEVVFRWYVDRIVVRNTRVQFGRPLVSSARASGLHLQCLSS